MDGRALDDMMAMLSFARSVVIAAFIVGGFFIIRWISLHLTIGWQP